MSDLPSVQDYIQRENERRGRGDNPDGEAPEDGPPPYKDESVDFGGDQTAPASGEAS